MKRLPPTPTYSIEDIAAHLNAQLRLSEATPVNEPATETLPRVSGYQTLDKAIQGEVAFIYSDGYLDALSTTQASYVIISPALLEKANERVNKMHFHALVMDQPRLGFARLTHLFSHFKLIDSQQIHPSAVIDDSVQLPRRVRIDANAVISARVILGEGCWIGAGSFIGEGSSLGANCLLNANVSILHDCHLGQNCFVGSGTVIGSEGFGYEWQSSQGWVRIHHQGRVMIADEVDIGANCSIDRGTIADTEIHQGAKIDNLVMIAHNCQIGSNSLLAGQTGMAGHTHLGQRVQTGGQVGFAGFMQVADDVTFSGKAMVSSSINQPNQHYAGYPAQPVQQWRKEVATVRRLVKSTAIKNSTRHSRKH